jgi:serine-type D-Ala-D-Ala carboxypeptidase (penicillin-binding protein 5/6)
MKPHYTLALSAVMTSVLALAPAAMAQVPAFETPARSAVLIDATTGAVLFEKAADSSIPPASMTKMMTVYLAFEMITKGQAKTSDMLTMSPETWKAWHSQGSTMFLSAGQQVSIDDLLHGIVTLSGNDACVVLAEGLAGSEQAFAQRMNALARKIGLTSSNFTNSTGWPDPDEYVTARDLAKLAQATIRDYPELYKAYYGKPDFTFGKTMSGKPITQGNRNPILGRVNGADGLKTGHTDDAGFGFTGSAKRGDQRLIMVVSGLGSMAERQDASVKLIEWGFRTFQSYKLFNAGQPVEKIPVWMGKEKTVTAVPATNVAASLTRFARADMKVKVRFNNVIQAPVKQGQKIGELIVTAPGIPAQSVPLVASKSVARVSGVSKVTWLLSNWVFGRQ